MATIHIARSQQSLGSFGEAEIREGIRSGRFTANDLAWREGMETWKPLGEMAPQWGLETPPPALEAVVDASPRGVVGGDGGEPAWEERERIGFFPAIAQTVQSVLIRPSETFASLRHTGGLAGPLLYFVLLGSATFAVSALYQLIATAANLDLFGQLQHTPKAAIIIGILGSVLISPAYYVLGAFLSSGITHLVLKLLGGAHRPFETTFRVICYAQGSASVFYFLPLCGWLFAILWGSYAIIIGLKEAHGTEAWRTTLALVLPGLLCCGILAAGGVAAGLGMAELGKLGH